MEKMNILYLLILSSVFGYAMSMIEGLTKAETIIMAIMYFSSFAIIWLLYLMQINWAKSSAIIDDIIKSLKMASYYISSGIPINKSIAKSASSCSAELSSGIITEVAARARFGDTVADSILNSTLKYPAIHKEMEKYLKHSRQSMAETILLYENAKKASQSQKNALSQRYATLGMFASTVAPSFVIFSFVGSLLISQKSASLFLLSAALTIVIPVAYCAISSLPMRS